MNINKLAYLEKTIDMEGGANRGPLSGKEILVYSPEKTGTVSLYHMVGRSLIESSSGKLSSYEHILFHNHHNRGVLNNMQFPPEIDVNAYIRNGRYIIRELIDYKTLKEQKVTILSSFRDPVKTAISLVFQQLNDELEEPGKLSMSDLSYESIYDRLSVRIHQMQHKQHSLEEIESGFFTTAHFDHKTKCCFVERPYYRILVLCLEHTAYWPVALSTHLGFSNLDLRHDNDTNNKPIADKYKNFKETLKLSPELIRNIYYGDHPLRQKLQWFYTDNEITAFYNDAIQKYGGVKKTTSYRHLLRKAFNAINPYRFAHRPYLPAGKRENTLFATVQKTRGLFDEYKYDEAICTAREGIKRWPGNLALHETLLISFTQTGDPKQAAETFATIREKFTDIPIDLWINGARAYSNSGNHEMAVITLQDATAAHPDNTLVHIQLADFLAKQQDWGKSADLLLKASRLDKATAPPKKQMAIKLTQYLCNHRGVFQCHKIISELNPPIETCRPSRPKSKPMQHKQFLMITGVPRSGTTAVTNLFNLAPEISIFKELFSPFSGYHPEDFCLNTLKKQTEMDAPNKEKIISNRAILNQAADSIYIGDKAPLSFYSYLRTEKAFKNIPLHTIFILRAVYDVCLSYHKRLITKTHWPATRTYHQCVTEINVMTEFICDLHQRGMADSKHRVTFIPYSRIFSDQEFTVKLFDDIGVPITEQLTQEIRKFHKESETILHKKRSLPEDIYNYMKSNINWDNLHKAEEITSTTISDHF